MTRLLNLSGLIEWIKSHEIAETSCESVFLPEDSIGDDAQILATDGSKVRIELSYEGGCESDPYGGEHVLRFRLHSPDSTTAATSGSATPHSSL